MSHVPRVLPTLTTVAVTAGLLAAAPALAAAAPPAAPSPGARSLGDSLFPELGNGGYDAKAYDFALTYGAEPTDPVDGTITMLATATQALSDFSVDYGGTKQGTVTVNGRPARTQRIGEKLVITPARPLAKGLPFVVRLTGFVKTPQRYDRETAPATDLFATPSGTATAGQPAYAHDAFPLNDHPLDKAAYTFRITAPSSETAVASGVLAGKRTKQGRTTWTYVQRQPMASELLQIAVGDYKVINRGRLQGVPVRDVVARSFGDQLDAPLATVDHHLAWLQARLGKYPFDVYGSLAIDASVGFALETQTLSLFNPFNFFDPGDPDVIERDIWEPTMVHELAHQWWGNSVSPGDWADLWINEGHATWYENTYALEEGISFYDSLEAYGQNLYGLDDEFRTEYGPAGAPRSGADRDLFNVNVYYGGALVLFALREEIGDAKFRELERTYVTRYAGQTKRTADYVALASKIAGKDLTAFFDAWLYGETTPPMPNHPDWETWPYLAPEGAGAPAALARGVAAPPADRSRSLRR